MIEARRSRVRCGAPGRFGRGLLLAGLLGLLAGGPVKPAVADEPSPASPVVELVVAGATEAATALADVAAELLRRVAVELRVERVERLDARDIVTPQPTVPDVVARAWIDLAPVRGSGGELQVTLYLVDGAWERVRVRRVPTDAGVDEVVREELAHVLASGVDGLLAGRPLEQTREELRAELGLPAPPPAPPPPVVEAPAMPAPVAAPPEPSPVSLRLGVGYQLTGFAAAAPVSHGPFAVLGVGLRQVPLRPSLWLLAQERAPLEADGAPIGVRLDQGVFRLLAAVDVPLTGTLALALWLGGGVDVVRATPTLASGASAVLAEPSTSVLGLLRAAVGLRWRLFGATELLATLGCDVDVRERTYYARRDGAEQRVLEPWLARPFLELALATELLGP